MGSQSQGVSDLITGVNSLAGSIASLSLSPTLPTQAASPPPARPSSSYEAPLDATEPRMDEELEPDENATAAATASPASPAPPPLVAQLRVGSGPSPPSALSRLGQSATRGAGAPEYKLAKLPAAQFLLDCMALGGSLVPALPSQRRTDGERLLSAYKALATRDEQARTYTHTPYTLSSSPLYLSPTLFPPLP